MSAGTQPPPRTPSAQTEQLRADIADLADAVATLAERTNRDETAARRGRRVVAGLIFSLVLDFALTGVLIYTSREYAGYVDCQADWSQAYAASAGERGVAAEADRRAIDDMVAAVLTARTREQSRAALENYQRARVDADAQRAEHPPPALPDDVCR